MGENYSIMRQLGRGHGGGNIIEIFAHADGGLSFLIRAR
jgi:hypothetical protein